MSRFQVKIRVSLAMFCVCAASVFGQGTDLGAVRGLVTDPSGGTVPNATVTIIDLATDSRTTTKTNNAGEYEANSLKAGSYKISIVATGFSTVEVTGVTLRAGSSARADARLEVAHTGESVVVQSEAPLTEMDLPTISSTLSGTDMVELPRDSRDFTSFLYLNPNIRQGTTDGSFKFLGAQSYGASFSVDGQRTNGGVFGEPTTSQPSLETIGELTVLSNSFTAEFAGIANIRVTTRRGGAKYHGSLFYDNKNSALAAWTLSDKIGQANFSPTPAQSSYPNPYFNLNEFGGSFGGPVPKIKNTYFFAAYERRYLNSPVYLRATNLPHATLLAGDFSLMTDARKPVVPAGVTLTPAEVSQFTVGGLGNQFIKIPSRLLNPITTKLVQMYFPQTSAAAPINPANGRLVDYFTNQPGTTRRNLGTLRLDHDFRESDRFYAVYNAQNTNFATAAVASPYLPFGLTQNERSNQTLSLSETHLFSPRIVNEVRGGFNRVPWLRHSNQTLRQFLKNIGFNDADITGVRRRDYTIGARHVRPPCDQFRIDLCRAGQRRPEHVPAARSEPDHLWRHSHLGKRLAHVEVRRGLRAQCRAGRFHQRPRQSARPDQLHRHECRSAGPFPAGAAGQYSQLCQSVPSADGRVQLGDRLLRAGRF